VGRAIHRLLCDSACCPGVAVFSPVGAVRQPLGSAPDPFPGHHQSAWPHHFLALSTPTCLPSSFRGMSVVSSRGPPELLHNFDAIGRLSASDAGLAEPALLSVRRRLRCAHSWDNRFGLVLPVLSCHKLFAPKSHGFCAVMRWQSQSVAKLPTSSLAHAAAPQTLFWLPSRQAWSPQPCFLKQ